MATSDLALSEGFGQVGRTGLLSTEWLSKLLPEAWLFVRLVLGVEWVRAGWEKIGDPGWTKAPVGGAVQGFLNGAIAKATQGDHPEVQHWFHTLAKDVFLPNAEVLAYLVAYGELLVGIALIVGFLTRTSVLFGVSMNLAFLLAGTTSSNPQMLVLGLAIATLGTSAGAYGVDRWLLPWLRRRLRVGALDAARVLAFATAAVVAAWFAWTITDAPTWIVAAAIALVAGMAFRTMVARSGD